MTSGASVFDRPRVQPRGTRWASIIALVFAAAATLSFAVDMSVALTETVDEFPAQATPN